MGVDRERAGGLEVGVVIPCVVGKVALSVIYSLIHTIFISSPYFYCFLSFHQSSSYSTYTFHILWISRSQNRL